MAYLMKEQTFLSHHQQSPQQEYHDILRQSSSRIPNVAPQYESNQKDQQQENDQQEAIFDGSQYQISYNDVFMEANIQNQQPLKQPQILLKQIQKQKVKAQKKQKRNLKSTKSNQQVPLRNQSKNIPSNNIEKKLNTYKISFYDLKDFKSNTEYFSKLLSSSFPFLKNQLPKYLKVVNGVIMKSTNYKSSNLGEDTNNVSHYVVRIHYKNLEFKLDIEYSESIQYLKDVGKEVRKWQDNNIEDQQKKILHKENFLIFQIMIKQIPFQKNISTAHELFKYVDTYLSFLIEENSNINQIKEMRKSTLKKLEKLKNENNLL